MHEGLRAQKTARVTGARPGVLTELEPQGGAVTVGYVTAPGPLLVPPVLSGGDTLDDATVSFLLAQSLVERQELQEMEDEAKRREEMRLKRQTVEEAKALRDLLVQTERKMARIGRHVAAGSPVSADDHAAWQSWNALDHTASSSSSSGKRRKRKKRRKGLLPRNSSRPLLACSGYKFLPRSRRLFGTNSTLFLREGGFCAVRTCGLSTHPRYLARTSSVPVAPEEHRKMGICGRSLAYFYNPSCLAVTCSVFAGGVQDYGLFCEKTSRYAVFSASWFNSGYMSTSVYVVVFLAGCDAPRAVFPCLSAFRRRQQWQYTAGFTGDEAPCAVFSFPVVRPKMRGPVWTRRTVRRCISVVVQRPIPMVFSVQKIIEFPCCSSTSPLYLAVTCTCSVFACGVQDYGLFCEFLQEWVPYSTLLGSTVDTSSASVYEACWKKFTRFLCEGCRSSYSRVQSWRRQPSSHSCGSWWSGQGR